MSDTPSTTASAACATVCATTAGLASRSRDPLVEVAWDAARDAVGLEVAVIVEETAKAMVSWARDAVHAQTAEITRKIAKVMPVPARDVMATGTGPP